MHTDECLRYAAKTGKPFCIAECADYQGKTMDTNTRCDIHPQKEADYRLETRSGNYYNMCNMLEVRVLVMAGFLSTNISHRPPNSGRNENSPRGTWHYTPVFMRAATKLGMCPLCLHRAHIDDECWVHTSDFGLELCHCTT